MAAPHRDAAGADRVGLPVNTPSVPSGSTAVMARRVEPPDSLEFFPTPPWATRALFTHVLPSIGVRVGPDRWPCAWEPACGAGHMSVVLEEFCAPMIATDVFDYAQGDRARWPAGCWQTLDFLDPTASYPVVDWIITNPPFRTAVEFALLGLERAREGVALLVRTQWLESVGRYDRLFKDRPPSIFAPFVERVPMVKGRWDPTASTATSYAWFVWVKGTAEEWRTLLIPPGCRRALSRPEDLKLAATPPAGGLLDAQTPPFHVERAAVTPCDQ